MVHHFRIYESVHLLPVLDITLMFNTGAAFSFLADAAGWQKWVFVALALGVGGAILGWLRRLQSCGPRPYFAASLTLILVVARSGNVIDRLRIGHVVDFISAHWGSEHYFPAFNVAGLGDHSSGQSCCSWMHGGRAGARTRWVSRWMFFSPIRVDSVPVSIARSIFVERAIELFGAPIYVRHEIVHNRHVVDRLRGLGAIFVEELSEVPANGTVIFSAHGVSSALENEANARGLKVFDATCPLVTKVHMEVQRYARDGRDVILIGHAGHPEVEGTMGRFDTSFGGKMHLIESVADVDSLSVRDPQQLAFVTQTTLSVDDTTEIVAALRTRYPSLATPRKEDICYATQNRQDAVKSLLEKCDVLLVVGSRTSSNSNRLREMADRAQVPGYLVDGPEDLKQEWFEGKKAVGVTAGASAPELLVQQVVERLRNWGGKVPNEVVGREETVYFALPRELRRAVVEKSV